MTQLASQKSQLAKLMATENISVEHKKVKTASFDVKKRVLTLPIFEDEMSADLYDLMVSHEVGHALWTPLDGWKDAVDELGDTFKGYLNVIEDARIEKLIKRKFPGILPAYRKGYKELLDRDFFGTKGDDLTKYNFIDRINLFFKTGTLLPMISFDETESLFVERISNLETFEDTVALAKELFEIEKQKAEEKAAEMAEQEEDFEEDFEEDMGSMSGSPSDDEEGEESDEDMQGLQGSGQPGEGDEDEDGQGSGMPDFDDLFDDGDEEGEGSYTEAGVTAQDIMESSTERAFSNAVETLAIDDDSNYQYFTVDKNINKKQFNRIVDFKEYFKEIESTSFTNYYSMGEQFFKEWSDNNKNVINYMIKEFEMKKRAGELKRAQVAKTGELDMKKVFGYKFNEDLFKRTTMVPNGKNHGFVMLLDWSGSMAGNLASTIDQLMNFVIFCKKVRIPFDVYLFTNEMSRSRIQMERFERTEWGNPIVPDWNLPVGTLVPSKEVRIVQAFSSDMGISEFKKACVYMSMFRTSYNTASKRYRDMGDDDWKIYDMISAMPSTLRLSGTPLNDALLIMDDVINEFKAKYRVEICNLIVLTDGDSHDCDVLVEGSDDSVRTCSYLPNPRYRTKVTVRDIVTKKNYRVKDNYTKTLLQIVKDRTDCNVIGFYIIDNKPATIRSAASYYGVYAEDIVKTTRENNFFEVNTAGYDSYFLIPGGKALQTDDSGLDIDAGESKRKIATAFKKNSKRKVTSRVFIGRVIELVA
jgi:hypothetical protein